MDIRVDMVWVWRSFRVGGAPGSAVALVPACAALAAACSTPRGTVTRLVTSHAPVEATATQLRQGVIQEGKDWADAKARIEEIQRRRAAEMLAIEADNRAIEITNRALDTLIIMNVAAKFAI